MMGAKFETTEMTVAGINFVIEYLIRFVATPVKVLNDKPPDSLHFMPSNVSFFSFRFKCAVMITMPMIERMNSICQGVRFGFLLYSMSTVT